MEDLTTFFADSVASIEEEPSRFWEDCLVSWHIHFLLALIQASC